MELPKLYVIATPMGNLKDITQRALETFQSVTYFFAEDTREFRKLLGCLGISVEGKHIFSYASHNMKEATQKAVELMKEGHELALVSDRGTPAISDPGALLVTAVRDSGFIVVPVPGVSSPSALFSVAGISESPYVFLGFLPQKDSERKELFKKIITFGFPVCFFESPNRVRATLLELKASGGSLLMGRELTKMHEEIRWFELSEISGEEFLEKGEYTLIWKPKPKGNEGEEFLQEQIRLRRATDKEWTKWLATKTEYSAREIYDMLQKIKK